MKSVVTRPLSHKAGAQAIKEQGQSMEGQRVSLEKQAARVRADEDWQCQPPVLPDQIQAMASQ